MSPEPAMQEQADPRGDDLALSRAVASGDATSLRSFFDSYADLLFAFLLHRMKGTRADVEDAWQETLAAAARGIGSYRGENAWVWAAFTLVGNVIALVAYLLARAPRTAKGA